MLPATLARRLYSSEGLWDRGMLGAAVVGGQLVSSLGKVFLPGVGLTYTKRRVNWFPGELVSNSVSLCEKRFLFCPTLCIFYHKMFISTSAELWLRCAGVRPLQCP